MDKEQFRQQILTKLTADYQLLLQAATSSHNAAIHEDNIPDSKYETLALEASYIAQGQANRAQEIQRARNAFQQLIMQEFNEQSSIRMGALVHIENLEGQEKLVFISPAAGGMRHQHKGQEILLITPESPLGRELIGRQVGDCFELTNAIKRDFEIIAVE